MTLDKYLDICGRSSAKDWNLIACLGGGGPSYLNQFIPEGGGPYPGESGYELRLHEHESRAAFKGDLAIGIAWGMHTEPAVALGNERRTFNEGWATKFPDPEATSHFLDFFYNGALVERQRYVHVDSRCDLPMPDVEYEGQGPDVKVTALTITPWQLSFYRILNDLQRSVDYDSYVERAGFQIDS